MYKVNSIEVVNGKDFTFECKRRDPILFWEEEVDVDRYGYHINFKEDTILLRDSHDSINNLFANYYAAIYTGDIKSIDDMMVNISYDIVIEGECSGTPVEMKIVPCNGYPRVKFFCGVYINNYCVRMYLMYKDDGYFYDVYHRNNSLHVVLEGFKEDPIKTIARNKGQSLNDIFGSENIELIKPNHDVYNTAIEIINSGVKEGKYHNLTMFVAGISSLLDVQYVQDKTVGNNGLLMIDSIYKDMELIYSY